jgi:hypothetical protein
VEVDPDAGAMKSVRQLFDEGARTFDRSRRQL